MSLKRPLSSSPSQPRGSTPSMSNLPAIPKITGEIILETFTHKSLGFGGFSSDESGDNQRLAELGDKVLELAVTNSLYHKRPLIKAENIPVEREKILAAENVEGWVSSYHLRDKLRRAPDANELIMSAEETRSLFNAYVGAVFTHSGMRVITDWIGHLVDAESVPPTPDESIEVDRDERFHKRVKNEPMSDVPPPPAPVMPAIPPSPFMGVGGYPQSPGMMPPTNAMNIPSQSTTMAFLPLFNQTCAQRKLNVEYQAEFQGPPHAGRWNIKCVVNGVIKGQGQGVSKQLAKEEAAKQAFYGMGFGGFNHGM